MQFILRIIWIIRILGFKDSRGRVFFYDLIYQSQYNPGPQIVISGFPSHNLALNFLYFSRKPLESLNPRILEP